MSFLDQIGLEHPVVQAGMGGGISGGELAGAVSAAGALGTVGLMPARQFVAALAEARERAGSRPVAANLLVPFVRRAHVEGCIRQRASLVVLHGGLGRDIVASLRAAGIPVLVTVAGAGQARRAISAGATGLVVQGVEAGGHLAGTLPLDRVLPSVLDVADGAPVLAAGGVADASDTRRVLAAGATAVVAGTRFLLTEESLAHPAYKQRLLEATRTLRTMLFGVGWPLAHRVVPNPATDRWCAADDIGPRGMRLLAQVTSGAGRLLPLAALETAVALQRVRLPLFTPAPPLVGMPADAVDRSALYAGETVRRMASVVPAAEAVSLLVP